MPKHKTKLVNLILRKKRDGINQIALVEDPAINSGWQMFSAVKQHMFADKAKQMLYGAVMIPDKQILRIADNGEKYFVTFSSETIEKMQVKYMSQARTNEFNLHHDQSQQADVTTVESWIKHEGQDKANELGLSDVPSGSWIIGAKVHNKDIWDKAVSGELTGFSLEGFFTEEQIFSKQINNTYMSKPNEGFLSKFLAKFSDEPTEEEQKLEAVLVELAEGAGSIFYDEVEQLVFAVNEDGTQGEPLADGDYPLADGRILQVTDGVVSNIMEQEEQSKETDSDTDDIAKVLAEVVKKLDTIATTNEALSKEVQSLKGRQDAFEKQTPATKRKQTQTKQTGVHSLN